MSLLQTEAPGRWRCRGEPTPWTAKRLDLLRKMWAEGASARDIAKELGCFSRNAVLGKIHRLRLTIKTVVKRRRGRPRLSDEEREQRRRARNLARRSNAVRTKTRIQDLQFVEVMKIRDQDVPIEQRKSLFDLKDSHCRWPVGDPTTAEFFFCGGPKYERYPYCCAHQLRATEKTRDRLYGQRERLAVSVITGRFA
jgi:GcrA cell cycle regulator